LKSLQCCVDRAECHISLRSLFDLSRYRYAVRALIKTDYTEHDQQLEFAKIVGFGHLFDYSEEINAPHLLAAHCGSSRHEHDDAIPI